jgi:hypothetical protein
MAPECSGWSTLSSGWGCRHSKPVMHSIAGHHRSMNMTGHTAGKALTACTVGCAMLARMLVGPTLLPPSVQVVARCSRAQRQSRTWMMSAEPWANCSRSCNCCIPQQWPDDGGGCCWCLHTLPDCTPEECSSSELSCKSGLPGRCTWTQGAGGMVVRPTACGRMSGGYM